jgi:type VI secretion system protein ImpA
MDRIAGARLRCSGFADNPHDQRRRFAKTGLSGKPAGEDVTYDTAMQELDAAMQGKPETQFSAAEEPNWKEILQLSTDLSKRSKNLRVMVILTLALLKTEGLTGFRDGITLLQKSLEQYWDALYPRLDPEDDNDPTERVNILAAMLTPRGLLSMIRCSSIAG